ncbi:MAG TPA: hypothetical protein DEZ08_01270 [Dehalococcoidia bacterium]|jgi:hypothetical protein|nr:hypothetical protein [Dehalococcoidia bacterium]
MLKSNWAIGQCINIGWPDFGIKEEAYRIIDLQIEGLVFRARVTDGKKEGGFLIVQNCPDIVLEQIAEEATTRIGFPVIASALRCSVESNVFRSLDYEWYPTPEFKNRPNELTHLIFTITTEIFP